MSASLPSHDDAAVMAQAALPQRRARPSLVWVVPGLAAALGLWMVIASLLARGPLVEIRFASAEGLEAGKTAVEYRDVTIGQVESLRVADDGRSVIVSARIAPASRRYLVQDTRFYVVRPRVSITGVSGLGTLLAGPHIALDPGRSKRAALHFTGLEAPPSITMDVPGTRFRVGAREAGALSIGSPVFYHHVEVGEVVSADVEPRHGSVVYGVFVRAPFDRNVHAGTRFWLASGVEMSLDSNGVKVQVESLAAVLEGGVAFQTPASASSVPAATGALFAMYPDQREAMRRPDREVRPYVMYFDDSVRGLAVGAAVDFRGIVIGEVTSLGVEYLPDGSGVRIPVGVNIYPERMRERIRAGAPAPTGAGQEHRLVDALVAHGLRAQLRSGNLLTGQLYISFDFFPGAPPAKIDWSLATPALPTEAGGMQEIQNSLASVARKLDKLPLAEISQQLLQTMTTLDQTLRRTRDLITHLDHRVAPSVVATLDQAQRSLAAARTTLDADAPTQAALRSTLHQIDRSARALQSLTDYLERHPESLIRGKRVQP